MPESPLEPIEFLSISMKFLSSFLERSQTAISQISPSTPQTPIVHRDIKPENIQLISNDEQTIFAKLIDFGIARFQSQAPVTQLSSGPPSTWAYASPELHRGMEEPIPAIDIYALGVTLYEIIAATRPFTGEELAVVWAHLQSVPRPLSENKTGVAIPPELDALLAEMLEKDPARRPTAAEVARRLEELYPKLPSAAEVKIHSLRTLVLPENEDEPAKSSPKEEARAERGETRKLMQILKAARELDHIEGERERVGVQLSRECRSVLKHPWLGELPADMAELLQRSSQIQGEMMAIKMDLAVLQDVLSQERVAQQEQRDRLRQRLIELQDELRSLSPMQRSAGRAAAHELLRLERAYAAPIPRSETAERIHQQGIRRQELRDELLGNQRRVAQRLLRMVREVGKGRPMDRIAQAIVERVQQIAQTLSRLDDLDRALKKF